MPVIVPIAALEQDRAPRRLELTISDVRMQHWDVAGMTAEVTAALAGPETRPLAIGSVNLDHMYHFGIRSRRGSSRPGAATGAGVDTDDDPLRWLMLIDGSPVARRARACTGHFWPRLTGADLLPDLLTAAAATHARVGFLGGSAATEPALREVVARDWPGVTVAGVWTPSRAVIDDPARSADLAAGIAATGVDLLVVGLGKPRQELWIARHGLATQASVLTAFGAAAEFLAGSASRAPVWMRRVGIEWFYRLASEPRRLWRRYLLQGPVALGALLRGPVTIDYVAAPGGDPPR